VFFVQVFPTSPAFNIYKYLPFLTMLQFKMVRCSLCWYWWNVHA